MEQKSRISFGFQVVMENGKIPVIHSLYPAVKSAGTIDDVGVMLQCKRGASDRGVRCAERGLSGLACSCRKAFCMLQSTSASCTVLSAHNDVLLFPSLSASV